MNEIKFIMQFIYNRAVTDPEKLNHYEPFSPQVYGETSFELIEQMLSRVNYLNENDIFLDLGSGIILINLFLLSENNI
jgi:H3 lysine-79-specific histone-lysine N-methyltransferase